MILPCLDLPDLTTTMATGTRARTRTMANVKDRERSNKAKGQGNQDGKWCHIHQSNLHDLKECHTAIEMF
jgi:hypothetical protein